MTPDILEFLLRATTVWAVVLGLYFAVRRWADFRSQRVILLGGWLAGLAIPLLPAVESPVLMPAANLPTISLTKTVAATTVEVLPTAESWTMIDVLPWLYLLGVVLFGARTLVRGRVIGRCLAEGRRSAFGGYTVVTASGISTPFAARGYVFLPEGLDPALTHTALLHETAHLRARHHYDKALMNLTAVLLWFHPLVWVYRRLLATVHEYEADAAVLRTIPAKTYGLQLIRSALAPGYQLGLFTSPLKQRIAMFTQNPERRFRLLPMFTFLLLLAGLTVACSDIAGDAATPEYEVVTGSETPEMVLPLYRDAEDSNGSMKAYLTDVYQEITYPAAARGSYTTGKFRAKVAFGKDGKIETVDISPFTDVLAGGPPATEEIVITGYATETASKEAAQEPELLTREIDRVVRLFDNWNPAVRKGQPKKRVMNLDFNFRLEE